MVLRVYLLVPVKCTLLTVEEKKLQTCPQKCRSEMHDAKSSSGVCGCEEGRSLLSLFTACCLHITFSPVYAFEVEFTTLSHTSPPEQAHLCALLADSKQQTRLSRCYHLHAYGSHSRWTDRTYLGKDNI